MAVTDDDVEAAQQAYRSKLFDVDPAGVDNERAMRAALEAAEPLILQRIVAEVRARHNHEPEETCDFDELLEVKT